MLLLLEAIWLLSLMATPSCFYLFTVSLKSCPTAGAGSTETRLEAGVLLSFRLAGSVAIVSVSLV